MTGGLAPGPARLALAGRVVLVLAAAGVGAAGGLGQAGPLVGAALGLASGVAAVVVERLLAGTEPCRVLGGLVGLAGGLVCARLLPMPSGAPLVLAHLGLGWAGLALGARDLSGLRLPIGAGQAPPSPSRRPVRSDPLAKVVDTSVIIDGRIGDVVDSGFVEGRLLVPQFVIRELQQVADSSDPLKRARGRKGLDVLRALQQSERVDVEITDRDFDDIADVDGKLIALAEEADAKVLTNDYNLNKVAQLRGVAVLNVNDLANAVKPVVLPGESLTVQVIKEGKERNQGVGYLDDGTMVVVDNARDLLGENLDVLVTSVIQTNAGKMIFAAPDEGRPEQTLRIARRAERASNGHSNGHGNGGELHGPAGADRSN